MGKVILPRHVESVGEHIELPDMAELLMMPMFGSASADDFYKHGTDFQRLLLSKTPLKNNTKYVSVHSMVQLLDPTVRANVIKLKGKYENEWHIDINKDNVRDDCTWHIFMNKCTSMTEFSNKDVEIDEHMFNTGDGFFDWVNSQVEIEPIATEPNRIHSFTQYHLHKASTAKRIEFRYFFRVMETNFMKPVEKFFYTGAPAFMPDGKRIETIKCLSDGVFIDYGELAQWQSVRLTSE